MAYSFGLSSVPRFSTEGLASELSLVRSCGNPIVGYLGNVGHPTYCPKVIENWVGPEPSEIIAVTRLLA